MYNILYNTRIRIIILCYDEQGRLSQYYILLRPYHESGPHRIFVLSILFESIAIYIYMRI